MLGTACAREAERAHGAGDTVTEGIANAPADRSCSDITDEMIERLDEALRDIDDGGRGDSLDDDFGHPSGELREPCGIASTGTALSRVVQHLSDQLGRDGASAASADELLNQICTWAVDGGTSLTASGDMACIGHGANIPAGYVHFLGRLDGAPVVALGSGTAHCEVRDDGATVLRLTDIMWFEGHRIGLLEGYVVRAVHRGEGRITIEMVPPATGGVSLAAETVVGRDWVGFEESLPAVLASRVEVHDGPDDSAGTISANIACNQPRR